MHGTAKSRDIAQKFHINLANLVRYVFVHEEARMGEKETIKEKSPTHIGETIAILVKFSKIKLRWNSIKILYH